VICARLGRTTYGHVRVTNRLDLLEAFRGHDFIETAEQVIKHRRDARRIVSLRPGCEVDEIGEEHGRLGVNVGDVLLAALQATGDGQWYRVGQKFLGSCLRLAPATLAVEQHGEYDAQRSHDVDHRAAQLQLVRFRRRRLAEDELEKRRPDHGGHEHGKPPAGMAGSQCQQRIGRYEEGPHDARRAQRQAAAKPRDDRNEQGARSDQTDDVALEALRSGEHQQVRHAER
jgi:hypothetical protein